ncbi:LOW QUALITY PROTEIN: inactive serine protease 54 [Dasypus novemcinctus]|uniref:LOW QUALITY PROTEIN: inactive serine protease 54 n=1 Tax=Dasypus novemcinctus TaxID=9361 RepID=UPI00265D6CD7|nr:LOW QUALITY PROTEIN: inactive serine protease 54 [Dasypus novemcinctus]
MVSATVLFGDGEMKGMFLLLLYVSHSSANCGIQKASKVDTFQNMVSSKEFPWVVSLQDSQYTHLAFGCILSEFWILSIASTFQNRKKAVVLVGIANMDGKKVAHEEYPVNTIIIHEGFDNVSMKDNIALLKTDSAMHFNDLVQPICFLNGKLPESPALKNCWVSGWNPTSATGNHMTMSILRKVSMKDVEPCPLHRDPKTACCSLTHQDPEPTCLVDPGNPVMCHLQQWDVWVLKGVLSRGDESCVGPLLYTRVDDYSGWIKARTQRLGPVLPPSRPWKTSSLSRDLLHATELLGAVARKAPSGRRRVAWSKARFRGRGRVGLRSRRPANFSRSRLHRVKSLSNSGRPNEGTLHPMYYDYYGGEEGHISGQNRLPQPQEMLLVFFLLAFFCGGI